MGGLDESDPRSMERLMNRMGSEGRRRDGRRVRRGWLRPLKKARKAAPKEIWSRPLAFPQHRHLIVHQAHNGRRGLPQRSDPRRLRMRPYALEITLSLARILHRVSPALRSYDRGPAKQIFRGRSSPRRPASSRRTSFFCGHEQPGHDPSRLEDEGVGAGSVLFKTWKAKSS